MRGRGAWGEGLGNTNERYCQLRASTSARFHALTPTSPVLRERLKSSASALPYVGEGVIGVCLFYSSIQQAVRNPEFELSKSTYMPSMLALAPWNL